MSYLVDANVLSEPTKPDPNRAGVEWLRSHELEIVVDPTVVTRNHSDFEKAAVDILDPFS